ncbi:MAG: acetyltransferase [Paludibacter sp.]|nr:acetyltransferase [Paludibacter sp.]
MELKKLIIVGIGETSNLAYEYFTHDSDYTVVAFAVESGFYNCNYFLGLPIFKIEEITDFFSPQEFYVFIAISSTNFNRLRTRLYDICKTQGYRIASYVSSKAFVWHNVEIGENCFILENNTLQPFVKVGNNVTLWSGNHIGHQSIIHDNCFITSHVVISGFCEIGTNCFIGVNSSIANNIIIADDCLISLGSVISENTEENGIYKGNPAKRHSLSAKTYYNLNE